MIHEGRATEAMCGICGVVFIDLDPLVAQNAAKGCHHQHTAFKYKAGTNFLASGGVYAQVVKEVVNIIDHGVSPAYYVACSLHPNKSDQVVALDGYFTELQFDSMVMVHSLTVG